MNNDDFEAAVDSMIDSVVPLVPKGSGRPKQRIVIEGFSVSMTIRATAHIVEIDISQED